MGELIGLVLQERPETYDLDQLTPFLVDDVADMLPRVPTAGVGMRLAVKKDPKSNVGEDGNKKKVDPFKTLCVAVAGGRVSWWSEFTSNLPLLVIYGHNLRDCL